MFSLGRLDGVKWAKFGWNASHDSENDYLEFCYSTNYHSFFYQFLIIQNQVTVAAPIYSLAKWCKKIFLAKIAAIFNELYHSRNKVHKKKKLLCPFSKIRFSRHTCPTKIILYIIHHFAWTLECSIWMALLKLDLRCFSRKHHVVTLYL